MPSVTPLLAADPGCIGRYRLAGRLRHRRGRLARRDARLRQDGPAPFVIYLGRAVAGEPVTITLLHPVGAGDTAARDRFIAEADAACEVGPFCVARMLDAGFHGDFPYLVSEYVPGPSLAEAVAAQGPPTGEVLGAIAVGAATGLAAIHQAGLVHGRFGAEGLVLGPDGPRVVHSGVTPPYGLATPAADVHAWAETVLFAAGNPADGPADDMAQPRVEQFQLLPSALRQVVYDSLDRDPGSRPTAKVIVTRLLGHAHPPAGVLAAGSQAADPARTATRLPAPGEARPTRQRVRRPVGPRAAAGIAVAVVAVVAAVAAVVTVAHRGGVTTAHSKPTPRVSRIEQGATAPTVLPTRATASPTTSPPGQAPGVRIPASLGGTWSGFAAQAVPRLNVAARVRLTAGATTGYVAYPAFGCSGVLTLARESGRHFVFQQGIVRGQTTCGPGTVTLTPHGGTVGFTFIPATRGGPALHGTLSRQ